MNPRNIEFPVPAKEIEYRLNQILKHLQELEILILLSNMESQKPDSLYSPFRQNSDFFYFTGLMITPAIFVITHQEILLFYDPPNPEVELWTGLKPNYNEIKSYIKLITNIHPYFKYREEIPKLLEKKQKLYYPFGIDSEMDSFIFSNIEFKLRKGRGFAFLPDTIQHSYGITFEIRIKKTEYEIQQMREILKITKSAHIQSWKITKPERYEYEIHSEILRIFRESNAIEAYPSIIASGENACILHYTENNRKIQKNELILIDAGAQKNYIHTDITRTYPSSGKFNSIQKLIYEVVLEAQKKAIEKTRIGYCMEDAHFAAILIICDFLKQENILKESIEEIIEKELYKSFYMHRTGHYLGYDVHDSGYYFCYPYQKEKICESDFHKNFKTMNQNQYYRKFEPHIVCTVEPGLYFSRGAENIPEEFKGIGIRIEDNVLVTENDPMVLSELIPKKIEEIETIMQK